jgi:hypothetical protein
VSRTVERLIDLLATAILLAFAYMLRDGQPGLAGAVVMASIAFWLQKNAQSADSPAHKVAVAVSDAAAAQVHAAALAAAEVIKTATATRVDAEAKAIHHEGGVGAHDAGR